MSLRVLALQALSATSHVAVLDGWRARSRHTFDVHALPGHAWKWRMRHAAVTFAEALRTRPGAVPQDVVVCTDMLDVAAFRGLAPASIARRPIVLYMHENQFAYPDPRATERDLHFAFTNVTSALAADAVWWNSTWNRDALLDGLERLLAAAPDHAPRHAVAHIRAKSTIAPPGIAVASDLPGPPEKPPLRIAWAHRWEHDKDPETFFAALEIAVARGVDLRIRVLGPSFRHSPSCFDDARARFADRMDTWGWQEDREAYERALDGAHVFVSTARQEFFGLSTVEATALGCLPIVPSRLAYPDVLAPLDPTTHFHDGRPEDLADRLVDAHERLLRTGTPWPTDRHAGRAAVARYDWSLRAPSLDDALEQATRDAAGSAVP